LSECDAFLKKFTVLDSGAGFLEARERESREKLLSIQEEKQSLLKGN